MISRGGRDTERVPYVRWSVFCMWRGAIGDSSRRYTVQYQRPGHDEKTSRALPAKYSTARGTALKRVADPGGEAQYCIDRVDLSAVSPGPRLRLYRSEIPVQMTKVLPYKSTAAGLTSPQAAMQQKNSAPGCHAQPHSYSRPASRLMLNSRTPQISLVPAALAQSASPQWEKKRTPLGKIE
jgi:hypothetical protein